MNELAGDVSDVGTDTVTRGPVGSSRRRISGDAAWTARNKSSMAFLFGALVLVALLLNAGRGSIGLWTTVFVAVVIQAMPFVVLGTVVSATIATVVSPVALARLSRLPAAVGAAGGALAGVALPGCECGSIPVAKRLLDGGAGAPLAFAFLCSAPATNPVVLVATSVAFPGQPRMVFGRLIGGLTTAFVAGWWLSKRAAEGTAILERAKSSARIASKFAGNKLSFVDRARGISEATFADFAHAGGFLVVGAALTATLQTVVPKQWLTPFASSGVASIMVMALLAVVLSVCSEADAFVASGLTQFSLTSRLVFLVVGPVVDLKLAAMHVGTFGKAFTRRFLPGLFVVAVASATLVGSVLL
jgi:uncharacterized protein